MSPRWGLVFGCPMRYKHAAPLGLNTPMNQRTRFPVLSFSRLLVFSPLCSLRLCGKFILRPVLRVLRRMRLIRDSNKWHMPSRCSYGSGKMPDLQTIGVKSVSTYQIALRPLSKRRVMF